MIKIIFKLFLNLKVVITKFTDYYGSTLLHLIYRKFERNKTLIKNDNLFYIFRVSMIVFISTINSTDYKFLH